METGSLKQLYNHPLLNKTALAEKVFPGEEISSAKAKLSNKVKGNQGRYLSEEEEQRLVSILQELARDIDRYLPEPDNTTQPESPEPIKTGTNALPLPEDYVNIKNVVVEGKKLSDVFSKFGTDLI